MPGTIQPDRYHVGATGDFRQTDGTTDSEVLGWLGGLLYANVADSTAISNTTNETAFDVFATLPANTLQAGSVLEIEYMIAFPNTNGTNGQVIKLYIGTDRTAGAIVGTALVAHANTDVADNDTVRGRYSLQVRTAGTSGTMTGDGEYKSIPAAEGTATYKDDVLGSTTINTQAVQYIFCTSTNNAASTSNNTILRNLRVKIYK